MAYIRASYTLNSTLHLLLRATFIWIVFARNLVIRPVVLISILGFVLVLLPVFHSTFLLVHWLLFLQVAVLHVVELVGVVGDVVLAHLVEMHGA